MITINLSINNPFKYSTPETVINWYKRWQISKNKSFDIQLYLGDPEMIIGVKLETDWWGRDHAGPCFEINIYGLMFIVQIYDHRHWDWDTNDWISNDR